MDPHELPHPPSQTQAEEGPGHTGRVGAARGGPQAGFLVREVLLWLLFAGSLVGAVVAGTTVKVWKERVVPYEALSLALGLVAAASLVMACLERRPKP